MTLQQKDEYVALLSAMIADWRRTFNQPGLSFHIVDLADYLSKDNIEGRKAWAEMRQEQAKAAAINSNTYTEVVLMILILYVGITRAERKKIVSWIQTKMSKTKQ